MDIVKNLLDSNNINTKKLTTSSRFERSLQCQLAATFVGSKQQYEGDMPQLSRPVKIVVVPYLHIILFIIRITFIIIFITKH